MRNFVLFFACLVAICLGFSIDANAKVVICQAKVVSTKIKTVKHDGWEESQIYLTLKEMEAFKDELAGYDPQLKPGLHTFLLALTDEQDDSYGKNNTYALLLNCLSKPDSRKYITFIVDTTKKTITHVSDNAN